MKRLVLICAAGASACGNPSVRIDFPPIDSAEVTLVLGLKQPDGEQSAHVYELDENKHADFSLLVENGTTLQIALVDQTPQEMDLPPGDVALRDATYGRPLPIGTRYLKSTLQGDDTSEWSRIEMLEEPLANVRREPLPEVCYTLELERSVEIPPVDYPVPARVDAQTLLVQTTDGYVEVRRNGSHRPILGLPPADNLLGDDTGTLWAVSRRGGLWMIRRDGDSYEATVVLPPHPSTIAIPTHFTAGRTSDERTELAVLDHDADVWLFREGDTDWTIGPGLTSTVGANIWQGDIAWIGDGRAMVAGSTSEPTVAKRNGDTITVQPIALDGALFRERHQVTAASYRPGHSPIAGSWYESWAALFVMEQNVLQRRYTWYFNSRLIELTLLELPETYLYATLARNVGIAAIGSDCVSSLRIDAGVPRHLVPLGPNHAAVATAVTNEDVAPQVHFFHWAPR